MRKISRLRVGEGANWAGRNCHRKAFGFIEILIGTLLSVLFFAPAQVGRMNA